MFKRLRLVANLNRTGARLIRLLQAKVKDAAWRDRAKARAGDLTNAAEAMAAGFAGSGPGDLEYRQAAQSLAEAGRLLAQSVEKWATPAGVALWQRGMQAWNSGNDSLEAGVQRWREASKPVEPA